MSSVFKRPWSSASWCGIGHIRLANSQALVIAMDRRFLARVALASAGLASTTNLGLERWRSIGRAWGTGCARWAIFNRVFRLADIFMVRFFEYDTSSFSFQHPSLRAFSSSNTLLSSVPIISSRLPQLATGGHFWRWSGFLCSKITANMVGTMRASILSSSSGSWFIHLGELVICRAVVRTA
jgi:hypothetical protein